MPRPATARKLSVRQRSFLASAASTTARATGCSEPRSAEALKRKQFISVPEAYSRISVSWLALRNRARFVEHDGIDFMRRLQRFAALHEYARSAPFPVPTMMP
jgi:hypothetical protein